ncbi:MAG: PTS sugar transporter subunit IIA [Candidatus Omnitrophota bacterium]
MKISDYLKKDRISLCLKAQVKEDAVKELSIFLKGAPEIIDFDLFLKDVFERESLKTTGIGNGIAIPHARTEAVKNFVIVFGKSTEGVEFDSLDAKPVKLIFLMGTPKGKNLNDYLEILARLTRLLQHESFRNALLQASSPEEIINEFNKAEGGK